MQLSDKKTVTSLILIQRSLNDAFFPVIIVVGYSRWGALGEVAKAPRTRRHKRRWSG